MINSEICVGKYTGDGVATEFAIPFKYRLNNDLTAQIEVMTYDGETVVTLEQGSDYEVVQYNNEEIEEQGVEENISGGSLLGKIVFNSAPEVGLKIAILRNIPLVQKTDWVNGENIDMEAMEGEFDQITMCLQQMQERSTRTTTLSIFSETDPQTIVSSIEQYSLAAQLAANQAVEKANDASAAAESASSSEAAATSAKNDAATNALSAKTSANDAEASAALARQWAIGEPTEPSGNSAKHWAEQAAESAALLVVNDGVLDIRVNGETIARFSANQAGGTTVDITVPTVNNAVLTIRQGGVTKGTFSANASADEIIELDSGGGGSTYTEGNGIDISGGVISVAAPTLTNTATGANALSVGTAVASGAQSLALGHYAEATAANGVAIGQEATTYAIGAIQLGFGVNDEAGTFKVSLTTDGENHAQYTLLNFDGEIPSDRLGEFAGTLANNNYVLTYGSNTGVWKKYTAPVVDQAYSATSQNAQSGLAVAGAIANKADNSLANLSAAGRAYAAHLPMPGGNQVTFTLGASGATYTAPADGWFYVSISCTGVQGVTFVSLYNNTKAFGTKSDMYRATTATTLAQRCVIPASKGDVVAIAYSMGTPSSSTCKFIYANGAS